MVETPNSDQVKGLPADIDTIVKNFTRVLDSHGLHLHRCDSSSFLEHKEQAIMLFQKLYGETQEYAHDWMNANLAFENFQALLVMREDEIIAGQYSHAPNLPALCQELRSFVEQYQAKYGLDLGLVYGKDLYVVPAWQRKGLGVGLRAAYKQNMQARYPQGALLLSRIALDNPASMATAQLVNHKPTGIFDPNSTQPRQYWYGTTWT